MSDAKSQTLSGVAETLLIPLYNRAMESLRSDALIEDGKAVALVTQGSLDFSRVRQIPMNELLKAMRIIFTREFDRYTRDFLSRHPQAVVVHIGCGLDSRFERVDNGRVEWYDLDLPEVIELRRMRDVLSVSLIGISLTRSKSRLIRLTSAIAFSSLISASGRCDSIARR